MTKNEFYFDFYYNGRKIKRCICERTVTEFLKKMKIKQDDDFRQKRPARLTVVRIKKRKLSTLSNMPKIKECKKCQD